MDLYSGACCGNGRCDFQHGGQAQSRLWRKEAQKSGFGTDDKFLDVRTYKKLLHSKKRSLGKPCKDNTEASGEVADLNQKTMKAWGTLAILCSRFEKVSSLGVADRMVGVWGSVGPPGPTGPDRGPTNHQPGCSTKISLSCKMPQQGPRRSPAHQRQQICDRRDQYHRLSEDCGSVEEDVNEELGCVRDLVRDTTAAIHALSCGKCDRDNNEYLQGALELMESSLSLGSHHDDWRYC